MEDVKWLLKKWGFSMLILLIAVIAGVICWGKLHTEEKKVAEEVWEPLVEIEDSEMVTEEENDTETSTESAYWFIPQSSDCLITEEEKAQLQDMALEAAGQAKEVYEMEKQDAMVTIFEVNGDGMIGAVTFIYREDKLQTYYVGIGWQEGGIPEIRDTLVSDVEEINLTEKGYFIYAYKEMIAHGSMRQYWRIKPLSDECRKLTEKYIAGLSYVNYNVLVTNWDSSNVEDILMPCMFEDIYSIDRGENLITENRMIPAEIYENIMTTYFPVSVEQLRKKCGYDENNDSYPYEMIYASPYPPFGEVIDYKYNKDGTITLIVDGVWPDYNSDFAFRNKIVVQPFEDGTFKYLSNFIEQKELDLPPIARTKG